MDLTWRVLIGKRFSMCSLLSWKIKIPSPQRTGPVKMDSDKRAPDVGN